MRPTTASTSHIDALYQNNGLTSILFFYIIINKKLFRTTENWKARVSCVFANVRGMVLNCYIIKHGEQFMKKTKRILALIGAILLLLLYIVAFAATVLDHTSDMRYWKAAVAATIIIPVLIWAYSFVYRLLKGSDKDSDDVNKNKADASDKNDSLHK